MFGLGVFSFADLKVCDVLVVQVISNLFYPTIAKYRSCLLKILTYISYTDGDVRLRATNFTLPNLDINQYIYYSDNLLKAAVPVIISFSY